MLKQPSLARITPCVNAALTLHNSWKRFTNESFLLGRVVFFGCHDPADEVARKVESLFDVSRRRTCSSLQQEDGGRLSTDPRNSSEFEKDFRKGRWCRERWSRQEGCRVWRTPRTCEEPLTFGPWLGQFVFTNQLGGFCTILNFIKPLDW